MSARYWVLVSDELMASGPQWPQGLRVAERGGSEQPGMRWWLFEDDGAAPSLEGKQVELTFTRRAGKVMIGSRSLAA